MRALGRLRRDELIRREAHWRRRHGVLVEALERIKDEANLIDSICLAALAKHGGGQ